MNITASNNFLRLDKETSKPSTPKSSTPKSARKKQKMNLP